MRLLIIALRVTLNNAISLLNQFQKRQRHTTSSFGTRHRSKFPRLSGVPQGLILSPALFTCHRADFEGPISGCVDVSHADDITQVMLYQKRCKLNEIKRINGFEKRWEITTVETNFNFFSGSATKPREVIVDQ